MKTPPLVLLLVPCLTSLAAESPAHLSHGPLPGAEKSARSKVLGAGSEMLQPEGPVRAIHAHLCGFHFYNGDMQRQVRADHYCTHVNEEFYQCVIYDSDKTDARLIGIEYVISERLFNSLPDEEKRLWHSHQFEVKSGQLLTPRLPDVAEKKLMEDLVNTYGKTWHTWQVDRGDRLPLGLPQLMMGFTADGQANPELVKQRDGDVGIDSMETKRKRAGIEARPVAPGANAWEKGDVVQIRENGEAGAAKTE